MVSQRNSCARERTFTKASYDTHVFLSRCSSRTLVKRCSGMALDGYAKGPGFEPINTDIDSNIKDIDCMIHKQE